KTIDEQIYFKISYTGFEEFHRQYDLTKESKIELGEIALKPMENILGEIVIRGSAPPIRVKKDTLEFNVSSFKTKENANLEDLLKKLPGVTVDNDGSIKVNGKDVTNIKVNGKDFFGDDPLIATKNLPKDLLEKIQVVDTKSKSDEFTGKESESDDKTINVVISEEKNRGLFARLTAGGGTDHRYSLNGIANYFKNDLRLSVLGSANNINSIGFSFDEIYDAMGRSAYSIVGGQGGGGVTKSTSGGFDFVDSWSEELDFSANYFYNRASTQTESKVSRENLLPDRQYFNYSESSGKNVNNNHRGSFDLEFEPDTLTRISVRPNITVNDGYSENRSMSESRSSEEILMNDSETQSHSNVKGVNLSNRFDAIRRYGDQGGYFRLILRNRNDTQDNERHNYTSRNIYDENESVIENEIQDQLIKNDQSNDEYTGDARVRIPFDEEWKLDLGYNFTYGQNDSKRLVYETPETSDEYNQLNDSLSSNFTSRNIQHKPSVKIVYRGEKLTTSLTGGYESTNLKNEEKFTSTKFDNTFNNVFARFFMRYRIDQMKSLTFFYTNRRSIPSITQLQPIENTTNPLHIIKGNPDLKPTLTNRFSANYYNYNYKNHTGFYVYLGGRYNTDEVVASTTTGEDLVRTTTYTNVDGGYNLDLRTNYYKEFKFKDKSTLKPNIGARIGYSKDIGFSNDVRYNAKNFRAGPRVGLEYDIPDVLNISPSYTLSYNKTDYSLDKQRNQSHTDHDLNVEITSYWPENFIFGNDITYTHIGQTAPGFDNDYVLWNMSLGYEIWDGDGAFRITIFDLLNQNVSTRRAIGEDYVQDSQQLVLKRYAMFSFTYKISKFGGKKSREGGRRHYRRRG
ncbi:MAG TPA: outer membrane beta-barrel protein, partial [Flavobacteriaceae bacterium]|nr:outer membrane beta-barrel protein [Flavobacteriaceae bacterium]